MGFWFVYSLRLLVLFLKLEHSQLQCIVECLHVAIFKTASLQWGRLPWLIGCWFPVCKVSPSCLGPGDPATKHRLWGKRSTGTPEYLIELVQTLKIGHFSKVSVQTYLAASDGFFLWYFLAEVGIHPLSNEKRHSKQNELQKWILWQWMLLETTFYLHVTW